MKWIFCVLALLVACATVPVEDSVEPLDGIAVPDFKQAEVVLEKEESAVKDIADNSFAMMETKEIVCETLVSADEFARVCGLDVAAVDVTFRGGTKNCLVSIRHKTERTSNAGVELTRYGSDDKAESEFSRRLKVRMVGASDSDISGARAYEFDMIGLKNIEFLKGPDIVNVKSSVSFCPEDRLMVFARLVAGKL